MKRKELNKKLSFAKQTIVSLDHITQQEIKGGHNTAYKTACDYYTDCYNLSDCWTDCIHGWAC